MSRKNIKLGKEQTLYTASKISITRTLPRCFWCDLALLPEEKTRDHIIPIGQGGDRDGRVEISCEPCNISRGTLTHYYSMLQRARKGLRRTRLILATPLRLTPVTYPDERSLLKLITSLRSKKKEMLELKDKWKQIEMDRLGFSPTGNLTFDVP